MFTVEKFDMQISLFILFGIFISGCSVFMATKHPDAKRLYIVYILCLKILSTTNNQSQCKMKKLSNF